MNEVFNVPPSMSWQECATLILDTARDDGTWRVLNWHLLDVGKIRVEWEFVGYRYKMLSLAAEALWSGIARTLQDA